MSLLFNCAVPPFPTDDADLRSLWDFAFESRALSRWSAINEIESLMQNRRDLRYKQTSKYLIADLSCRARRFVDAPRHIRFALRGPICRDFQSACLNTAAYAHIQLREEKAAIDCLRQVVQISRDEMEFPSIHDAAGLALGQAVCRRGEYEEAIEWFTLVGDVATDSNLRLDAMWGKIACTLEIQGKHAPEILEYYHSLIDDQSLSTYLLDTLLMRALYFYVVEDFESAIRDCNRVLESEEVTSQSKTHRLCEYEALRIRCDALLALGLNDDYCFESQVVESCRDELLDAIEKEQ